MCVKQHINDGISTATDHVRFVITPKAHTEAVEPDFKSDVRNASVYKEGYIQGQITLQMPSCAVLFVTFRVRSIKPSSRAHWT